MLLEVELRKVDVKISNPNKFVEFALNLSQNLNKIWDSGNYQIKQAIQKLVFPTGLSFDTATMNYRTNSVNGLFASIAVLARVLEGNEKGSSGENPHLSALVVPSIELSNLQFSDLADFQEFIDQFESEISQIDIETQYPKI